MTPAQHTSMSEALAGRTGAARRLRLRRFVRPAARHAVLVLVALVFVMPLYWMVISGLKTANEIFAQPLVWWPHRLMWSNVATVMTYPGFPFLRFLWNSVFYAGAVTFGTVLSCAVVGYGFARLRFPGRNLLMAASTLTTLPLVALFFATRRYFLKGIAMTGLKG